MTFIVIFKSLILFVMLKTQNFIFKVAFIIYFVLLTIYKNFKKRIFLLYKIQK